MQINHVLQIICRISANSGVNRQIQINYTWHDAMLLICVVDVEVLTRADPQ